MVQFFLPHSVYAMPEAWEYSSLGRGFGAIKQALGCFIIVLSQLLLPQKPTIALIIQSCH